MNDDILFGVKGLSFTPGEQGFPNIVAPGNRPSIGTGAEFAGLSGKNTSYWWNAHKSGGYSIYDLAEGAIRYANPNNIKAGGIAGTGIAEKFYGMSDQQLMSLGGNPELRGSVAFAEIPKQINSELVSSTFAEPGVAGRTSSSGIQTASVIKPSKVMSLPEGMSHSVSGDISFAGKAFTKETLQGEAMHDWMQDFARNLKSLGIADEDLPTGTAELLNSTRTSEYESAIKKYLIEHENPKFRRTADEVDHLKLLSRNHNLPGQDKPVLAYSLGNDSTPRYASISNVDKIVEQNRVMASSSRRGLLSSKLSGIRGKISSTSLPKEGLSKAIKPTSSQTSSLMSAANRAAAAVSKNDSTAMRLAGAATTILRKRIL